MPADGGAVAALHAERIAEGFLATLGADFLRRLYIRVARSPHAFLAVATDADGLAGFAATAEDTGRLYRAFLLRDGVAAGVAALPRLLGSWRRVLETLRYGLRDHGRRDTEAGPAGHGTPRAEVLSVAVAPRAAGQGVGRALIRVSMEELQRRGVRSAQVVTRIDNVAALALYEGCGFRRRSRTEVHAGTAQEVLVWP